MSWYTGTGTATTTYYDDDIGTSTAATTYWNDDTIDKQSTVFEGALDPTPVHNSDPSITYDPEQKKFIVCRGLDYQDREFTTKRSALRFSKRWLDKKNGIYNKKKTPIYQVYKQKAKEAREREAHERWIKEINRVMAKKKKILAQEREDDEYLDRRGACCYE